MIDFKALTERSRARREAVEALARIDDANSPEPKPVEQPITLSDEQADVIEAIKAGRNVLVTGPAGTGKSTILKALAQLYPTLPVTASTGIAAVGVGGSTIHSWAGLGLAQDSAEVIAARIYEGRGKVYRRIVKSDRLALDEVSMIHADLMDLMDEVFRIVRKDERPFGGMQMILFGDFLQLPPVSRDRDRQAFAFASKAWKAAAIQVHMLTKVFRQADATFSNALNLIRVGNLTPEIHELLKGRLKQPDPNPEQEPITVYAKNVDVDLLNAQRLEQLEGEQREWHASDWGDPGPLRTLQQNCLAPEVLQLKIGAQVMLLWNIDTPAGLANGSIGIVKEWNNHTRFPIVEFRNGQTREIESQAWSIKIGGEVLAERRQVPLRLAYAITAHKSQGMTLEKIAVHLADVFEYGQAYVALSRCKTLEGLFIQSSKKGCIRAHPAAVKFYEDALRGEGREAALQEGQLL